MTVAEMIVVLACACCIGFSHLEAIALTAIYCTTPIRTGND